MVRAGCAFAVVGRDESRTLRGVIAAARGAARPGDEVFFVDSASSDGSADVARAEGVEIVSAPEGKGRAVATALARWNGTGWLCLLDGDITAGADRAATALREAMEASDAALIVGERDQPAGRPRRVTPAIYRPLVAALFPEARRPERRPLSGLRALSRRPDGDLPSGFGVEAHLNVSVALDGGEIEVVELGEVSDSDRPLEHAVTVGRDVARALLDLAQRTGRLKPDARPEWDAWADAALRVIYDPALPPVEVPSP